MFNALTFTEVQTKETFCSLKKSNVSHQNLCSFVSFKNGKIINHII